MELSNEAMKMHKSSMDSRPPPLHPHSTPSPEYWLTVIYCSQTINISRLTPSRLFAKELLKLFSGLGKF